MAILTKYIVIVLGRLVIVDFEKHYNKGTHGEELSPNLKK